MPDIRPPAHRHDLFPVAHTITAQDTGIATVILTAGNDADRNLLQLSYWAGTNTTASIPGFFLLPSLSLRGSNTIDLSGAEVLSYMVVGGPTAASGSGSVDRPHMVFPSHAKANLQPIIIPAGWMLCMAPLDANMDGTIIVRAMTESRR